MSTSHARTLTPVPGVYTLKPWEHWLLRGFTVLLHDPDVVRLAGDDDQHGVELLVGAAICAVAGAVLAGWAARAWKNRARPI